VSDQRSRVTTHVLDAVSGRPAAGVEASLHHRENDGWTELATGRTDDDGRIALFGPTDLEPGVYRVSFAVAPYFASTGQPAFYPEVVIAFNVTDPDGHYHVPLLLSPYAFSTYRGS
jgi:5-hydroxyisourate hydrolase